MATDPYKYLDQMRARSAQPSGVVDDPFEAELATQRNDELAYRIKVANPDEEARIRPIAEARGLPPSVVAGQLSAFEAEARAARAKSAMQEYPAIGRWSAKPGNAAIAADDYDNLGKLGAAFASRIAEDKRDLMASGGFVERMGDLFKSGVYSLDQGAAAVRGALQDWSARNPLPWTSAENTEASVIAARQARAIARISRDMAGTKVAGETDWSAVKARPTPGNVLKFGLDQGVKSVPGMAQAALMLPAYILGQAGSIGQTRANVQGREDANLQDVGEATPAALLSAALERVGIHGIFGATGKNAAMRATKAGATEAVTEFGQSAVEYIGGHSQTGTPFDVNEMLDQAFAGAVAGGVMGGGMRGTVESSAPVARRARGLVKQFTAANDAVHDGQFLDELGKVINGTKLATRDPDAISSLIRDLGEEVGVEHVFIPAEKIVAYQSSGSDNNYFGDCACPWRI
ncbi:hypothetical protein [Sphingobium sp. R-7]|uniref:hypothetical protein n=1 Tax=Sphingobium sp. R-7 TaxID=3375449 RepID=UPI00398B0DAA